VAEIQRFTADASHELRTPLAVLRSEAELSLRRPRTPEEYQQTLKNVVEEATRLGRLADQLLHLSRHDAGIVECRREPVRLDLLLSDVAEQLQLLAADRELSLRVLERTPCEIRGDDLQLRQALINVLDNALKYTPRGGSITLCCELQGSDAVLEVRDTGLGIPGEHLPRVFDRFYRVDPSRQSTTGGAGLGLAITRSTIRQHGGDVSIQSQEHVGTTVTIRLQGAVAIAVAAPLRAADLTAEKPSRAMSASLS
jgi:signal transduction histidine kinase